MVRGHNINREREGAFVRAKTNRRFQRKEPLMKVSRSEICSTIFCMFGQNPFGLVSDGRRRLLGSAAPVRGWAESLLVVWAPTWLAGKSQLRCPKYPRGPNLAGRNIPGLNNTAPTWQAAYFKVNSSASRGHCVHKERS